MFSDGVLISVLTKCGKYPSIPQISNTFLW